MFDENFEKAKQEGMLNALEMVMQMMLEHETDPCKKAKMQIALKCRRVSDKLHKFAEKYADPKNEEVSEKEAVEALEYLTLVEVGIDTYEEVHKGDKDE